MSSQRQEVGRGHESRSSGLEESGKGKLDGGYKLLTRRTARRHNKRRNKKNKGVAMQYVREG